MAGDNVCVAVRVRPFNSREKTRNCESCISMVPSIGKTIITEPDTKKPREFTYDYAYDSMDSSSEGYCSQQTVWNDIGVSVLENAYDGYNVSLFAYGQTGSGKSYSVMGYPVFPLGQGSGIIPIACSKIFDNVDANEDPNVRITVECSMMEIYMEKIRDLFDVKKGDLRIRQDPKVGFYVQDLSSCAVSSFEQIQKLMEAGEKARTIAKTNMNATSSRAHTIFQMKLCQATLNPETEKISTKVSLINLIDLAGSERQSGTGATGHRLKEGCAINKSLSALGNVISALAKQAKKGGRKKVVPYRDSVLTQLLKNSLGGNAKTYMIAAISPADINFSETLSTLRYADRAKQIQNKAIVNEDPNVKIIKGLQSEIEQLRDQLKSFENGGVPGVDMDSLLEAEREKIMQEAEAKRLKALQEYKDTQEELQRRQEEEKKSWEQKLAEAEARANDLVQVTGVPLDQVENLKKTTPYLKNLDDDEQMNGKIMHFFNNEMTTFGDPDVKDGEKQPDVPVEGLGIHGRHCVFRRSPGDIVSVEVIASSRVLVNGKQVSKVARLVDGDRVILGFHHVFLVVLPMETKFRAEEITWEEAIDEANAAHLDEVKESREAEEAAKKEREALEKQIEDMQNELKKQTMESDNVKKEMEAKMHALKEQETANEELHFLQSEYEKRILELEERTQDSKRNLLRQETKRLDLKKQEGVMKTVFSDRVKKVVAAIQEANALAEEIGKKTTFKLEVRPVPVGDSKPHSWGIVQQVLKIETLKDVWVRSSAGWLCSDDEFMNNRIFDMREGLRAWKSAGKKAFAFEEFVKKSNNGQDPFDSPPIEQLIGSCAFPLTHVTDARQDLEISLPILDFLGEETGRLAGQLLSRPMFSSEISDGEVCMSGSEETDADKERFQLNLTVTSVHGIPSIMSQDVFVEVDIGGIGKSGDYKTNSVTGIPANFNHRHSLVVTRSLLAELTDDDITFEVYGTVKGNFIHAPSDSADSTKKLAPMSARSQLAPLLPMSAANKRTMSLTADQPTTTNPTNFVIESPRNPTRLSKRGIEAPGSLRKLPPLGSPTKSARKPSPLGSIDGDHSSDSESSDSEDEEMRVKYINVKRELADMKKAKESSDKELEKKNKECAKLVKENEKLKTKLANVSQPPVVTDFAEYNTLTKAHQASQLKLLEARNVIDDLTEKCNHAMEDANDANDELQSLQKKLKKPKQKKQNKNSEPIGNSPRGDEQNTLVGVKSKGCCVIM